VLAWLLALGGCAVVGPFDDETLAPVRRGEKAIVLLRFVVTDEDGTAMSPFMHTIGDDGLGLALGDFDTGGVPERRPLAARFPSETALSEGAVVLFLSPGYHYLAMQGARRTDAFTYEARFRSVPRWRLAVPRVPVIYAGTFRLQARAIHLLFGDTVIGEINHDATVVEDEAAWASVTAARDLPGLPPPVTRLAVRHAGPVLLGQPPA
jgi:hypothetical protein